ncbi:hypothetical protein PF004_g10271 [Phytophthora fragariae]|uniref:FHA domain-containing protein n=1 Tax=Phytophthora fragariae TaxID=53985 RepID=A0A6G0P1K0_9STRA|nr:hypothetical protein PF004_g10271 [Phytophthora fragariae]
MVARFDAETTAACSGTQTSRRRSSASTKVRDVHHGTIQSHREHVALRVRRQHSVLYLNEAGRKATAVSCSSFQQPVNVESKMGRVVLFQSGPSWALRSQATAGRERAAPRRCRLPSSLRSVAREAATVSGVALQLERSVRRAELQLVLRQVAGQDLQQLRRVEQRVELRYFGAQGRVVGATQFSDGNHAVS